MRDYEEWRALERLFDRNNPFSAFYAYDDGSKFYVEPVFYTQLEGFKLHHPSSIHLILDEMKRIVKANKKVVFTGDDEYPLTKVEDAIYISIFDITDRLQIYVEDKSRGSDYGD